MPVSDVKPTAINLSHHLNAISRNRAPSPLKDIIKYMILPDMLSLAGGLPHPSLFPFAGLTADVYPSSTFLNALDSKAPDELESFTIPKTSSGDKNQVFLDATMQYSNANGLAQLRAFAHEFTSSVLQPAYSDFEILVTNGNTDAWAKVMGLLSEEGDYILVEEHTYPSAQAHWIPRGSKAVPLKMDGQGIRSDYLKEVLDGWEVNRPGAKKPHVLYTVPVGQNPTGTTMGLERKKEIYQIAVDHDIVIVEDDPYYALQYSDYVPNLAPTPCTSVDDYLKKLVPSFLRCDYQGRVIRLETFSKTLAPGSRLGYFVCNPLFSERLLRATEVETQTASGFSQAIITTHLQRWGQEGYLMWLGNLCEQYRIRRDWLVQAFEENFELVEAKQAEGLGLQGLLGYFKDAVDTSKQPPISFVCPTAGMFIFVRLALSGMKRFEELKADTSVADPEETCMNEIWHSLIAVNMLLTPGSYYHPYEGLTSLRTEKGYGHFRFAYSVATKTELSLALSRFEGVLKQYWQ